MNIHVVELVGIIVALFMVRGIFGLVKGIGKQIKSDLIFIFVWRVLSGAHLHGRRPTDATWWSHGSTTDRRRDVGGFLDRWEHKPRGHRAMWRLGCLTAFSGLIYGLFADRTVTLNALRSLVVYVVVVVAFVIESKIRLRVHNRHIVNPIVKSLAPVLRLSPHTVRRMLHISPENITDEGEVGYLELLPEITPGADQQASVERIIDAHLPVDIEMDWRMQQAPKLGVIRAGLKPPLAVPWDSMLDAMAKCAAGDVILGRDRFKDAYGATFTGLDDPHWGNSVQSGSGKSNFLAVVCAQILHQDVQATVSVIDPKRVSLIDYLGSPGTGIGLKPLIKGVRMANNPLRPSDMRDVIRETTELMERRALQAERDRTVKFPLHLLVIDELNMFTDIMLTYWRGEVQANKVARADDKTIPELTKDDPMWADIRAILRMGRFTNVHMVVVSQDLRDDAFGGKGARNYLGFRGLGNYNKKQFDMLVGTSPYPVPQKGIGRWLFVNSGEQTWVQITHGDESKVYAYASAGREAFDAQAALALDEMSVQHADTTVFSASILPAQTDGQPVERARLVGIKAAADHLGKEIATFERARTRYKQKTGSDIPGTFKVGQSPAWYADDLMEWQRNRPGSKED